MSKEINWIEFNENSNTLPPERKMCLVCFEPGNEVLGQVNGVCAGYLRYYSGGPFWVTHGVSRGRITHYADCLPEDFAQNIPHMNFPKKTITIKQ